MEVRDPGNTITVTRPKAFDNLPRIATIIAGDLCLNTLPARA
jgi:hypothetical protein